uniref:Viral phosphoribosylformylglycineamide amidotransferase n=1 Tax=Saimiriine herpesvirus 2 (strain 488) TaxID=10384 RepID=Q80BK5_SHV2C|nr:viral phosphoribosylformylglycineamide amidotransferase [Saimiriine gammaherpesvirus 2]
MAANRHGGHLPLPEGLAAPTHRTVIYYAKCDFSPSEERCVNRFTGRPGLLTLMRDRSNVEHMVLITVKTDEDRNTAEQNEARARSRSQETKKILTLLAPQIDYNPLTLDSLDHNLGQRAVIFSYGPDLHQRLTTSALELQRACRSLKLHSILRIESGRHFTSKAVQYVVENQDDILTAALIGENNLYQINTETLSAARLVTDALSWAEYKPLDVTCNAVMKPPREGVQPMCLVASSPVSDYNFNKYLMITPSCTAISLHMGHPYPQVSQGIFHIHSSTRTMGRQCCDYLFHSSLLPNGHTTAFACGYYVTSTTGSGSIPTSVHEQILHAASAQGRSLNNLGVPVVSGFLKPLPRCSEVPNNVITHVSQLRTASQRDLNLCRVRAGQFVAAVGAYDPTSGPDKSPYLYRDSIDSLNKAIQATKLFYQMCETSCVSSYQREFGSCSTLHHLLALVSPKGMTVHISRLPEEITKALKSVPVIEEDTVYAFVSGYFFNCFSSQLFLVIDDKVKNTPSGQIHFTEILKKAGNLCGAPVYILGRTCNDIGIHCVNDLYHPQDLSVIDSQTTSSMTLTVQPQVPVVSSILQPHEPHEEDESIDWAMFGTSSTISNILSHPAVASKCNIIRRLDRCGNGLIAQQPGIGPSDAPVSDYAIICDSSMFPARLENDAQSIKKISKQEAQRAYAQIHKWFGTEKLFLNTISAKVIALGEQAYKLSRNPIVGVKFAIAEAITNIMFGPDCVLEDITLTVAAHWNKQETAALYRVLFACKEMCRELNVNLSITDASDSRDTPIQDTDAANTVVVTAAARVTSIEKTTPALKKAENALVHVCLSKELTLSGSVFENSFTAFSSHLPDLDTSKLRDMFYAVKHLISKNLVVAGHDISDGGLVTTAAEMCFASTFGVTINLPSALPALMYLVSETPGALLEVPKEHLSTVTTLLSERGLTWYAVGTVDNVKNFSIYSNGRHLFTESINILNSKWMSYAEESFETCDPHIESMYRNDYGDNAMDLKHLEDLCTHKPLQLYTCPSHPVSVAVLTFPGCPDPVATLQAFANVGFLSYPISTEFLLQGNNLNAFSCLAVSGSSAFEEEGTGTRIAIYALLQCDLAKNCLKEFFQRPDTLSLCCGELGMQLLAACQVVGDTRPSRGDISSNPESWTLELEPNASKHYESLWLNFHVPQTTKSIILQALRGTIFPGWACGKYLGLRYKHDAQEYIMQQNGTIAMSYHSAKINPHLYAMHYPRNPSGNSSVAGICSKNGRHLALLVEPALSFHTWQWQHIPKPLVTSPWALMYQCMFLWCVKE